MEVIKAEMWHITGIFMILPYHLNFHEENDGIIKYWMERFYCCLDQIKIWKICMGSDCLLMCVQSYTCLLLQVFTVPILYPTDKS